MIVTRTRSANNRIWTVVGLMKITIKPIDQSGRPARDPKIAICEDIWNICFTNNNCLFINVGQ